MRSIIKRNLNREQRKRRSRAKFFGTAERPRISIFRSNKYTYAQLIDDVIGHTLVSASTRTDDQSVRTKTKTDQAKFLGKTLAEKAKTAGVKSAIFQKGAYKFHGRIKAVAEGAREAGLRI